MPFKVSPATELKNSADLVLGILTSPHRRGQEWNGGNLRAELKRIGLMFSNDELDAIATALIADGDLVTVP
jgi:hypothetical protein